MDKLASLMIAAAVAGASGVASADGHTYTYSGEANVQDSGIACRPQDGGKNFGSFSRAADGIKNTSTSSYKTVFCPITPPVWDSELGTQALKELVIWVAPSSTGSFPVCHAFMMDAGGVVATVANTEVYNSYYGAGAVRIFPSPLQSANVRPVSFGYSCDMPPGSRIHGSHARMTIGRVHGGI